MFVVSLGERERWSGKAYGSDMFTVSRSRSSVASTDVVFIQWHFLPRYRVQMYCSTTGIKGWEGEMIRKGFITRLTTQVRLPFSAISALVPYTLQNNSFFLFPAGGQEKRLAFWKGLQSVTPTLTHY